jgi:pyrophosphatase PpaX
MKSYQNYLFDSDGTLIDTVELIYRTFDYTCRKYAGFTPDRDGLVQTIGRPLSWQIDHYLGAMPAAKKEAILLDYKRYQLEIYPEYLRPFPGVGETLERLKAAGKRMAVVTSRKMETANLYLDVCGFRRYFDVLVTPELTEHHKPHPEPALKALALIGAQADESVFIGDASWDIECGQRAGMDTVFVTWSHQHPDAIDPPPTWRIERMDQLLV